IRGENVTVEEILLEYRDAKREVAIYTTELRSLEELTFVKITKYESSGGIGLEQEERYWKWMNEKDEIRMNLALAKRKVARVDTILDLLSMTHPHECNALLLYYVNNKGINYIASQIGYSRNITKNKIKVGEEEFEKLLNMQKNKIVQK
ncbi:hypothetical protein, partial [Turicibacter sanguinis]|uniref:hypothetical protein n=1 Tax=Turicibacter sanguinis TaxID=154288 RepID=UPI00325AEE0F